MADLLVRDIDSQTQAELKARAKRNGRSVSAEARSVLRLGLAAENSVEGIGTRMARLFNGVGLTDQEQTVLEGGMAEARAGPRRAPPDFGA